MSIHRRMHNVSHPLRCTHTLINTSTYVVILNCVHQQFVLFLFLCLPLALSISLFLSVCRCVYGSYSYYRFGLLSVIPDFDSSDTVCNKQCVCGFMLFILTFPYTAEDEGRKGEEEVVRRTIYIIISFKPCHNAIA